VVQVESHRTRAVVRRDRYRLAWLTALDEPTGCPVEPLRPETSQFRRRIKEPGHRRFRVVVTHQNSQHSRAFDHERVASNQVDSSCTGVHAVGEVRPATDTCHPVLLEQTDQGAVTYHVAEFYTIP